MHEEEEEDQQQANCCVGIIFLSPVVEQVVARVLHARRPLFSRPGHEAADGLVRQ